MAAHRYWRLNFITIQNNGNATSANNPGTALAEVQLCTSDGTNRCGSGTPSASSIFSGQPASNAFDGNAATLWSSNSGQSQPTWLAYDFGAGNTWDIQKVTLTARNDTAWAQVSPQTFYVQYSDDGVTWTNYWYIGTGQVATWTSGSTQSWLYAPGLANRVERTQQAAFTQAIPAFNGVQIGKAPTPGPRTVSGFVKVNGYGTAGLLVRAYAKLTGEMIGQATSTTGGAFSINCGANWADVYCLAFDPATFQALVFDQITPI